MIQFYAPDITETLTLPESDSGHCVRVLRMRAGDTIHVIDGNGNSYTCRIVDPHPKRTTVEIVETVAVPSPYRSAVTMAVAPTKNMDRMEWLVEKLTEIGVERIIPVLCRHSERKDIKTDRLERIAVSAMKQSLKAQLPRIDGMTPLRELVTEFDGSDMQRFIAYCADDVERTELAQVYDTTRDAVILIGPEGDFDPTEVEAAMQAGFIPVTLGPCRLRTETAALTACDTCRILQLHDKNNTTNGIRYNPSQRLSAFDRRQLLLARRSMRHRG